MELEPRGWVTAVEVGSPGNGRNPTFNGRQQPSCGGTSRMMREYQVSSPESVREARGEIPRADSAQGDSCTAAKRALLDNNVGALLELPWHLQAECLRGFEVDHKLKLCRPLDGELTRVCAGENAVDVTCSPLKHRRKVRAISH